jgi:hypothetical protein
MQLQNITSEDNLRTWLREQAPIIIDVELQWVEPSAYGSSTGCADVILKHRGEKVDIELKYLERTRKGTKFTIRPGQRRFHHHSMRNGGKTSLLAIENITGWNQLFLLRGDHIPLRDYIIDPASGQIEDKRWIVNDKNDITAISFLKRLLFQEPAYWSKFA